MAGALTVLLLVSLFLLNGVYRIRDHERFAVFRFRRFIQVKGPGWVFLIPALDRKIRINLDRSVPGWNRMPRDELTGKIKSIASTMNRRSP
jgi:regulator of protease activity HflC (stomatin/prohibitin superfamily)